MQHSYVVERMSLNKCIHYIIFNLQVQFIISQLAVSGLKVNRLDMYGEKYKPFKGVKYITKAGRFQIRM
jgi:hypothetical protein